MSVTVMSPEERERRRALLRFNNTCVRCGFVAWSLTLESQMQLRPKRRDSRTDATEKELACGECCRKQDAKAIDPSKMSTRLKRHVRKERKTIRRQRRKAT